MLLMVSKIIFGINSVTKQFGPVESGESITDSSGGELGGGGGSSVFKGAKIELSADQTISTGVNTKVTFNATDFDEGGLADLSNNQIVIPSGEAGKYLVTAGGIWNSASVSRREFRVDVTDSSDNEKYNRHFLAGTNVDLQAGTIAFVADLAAGDKIFMNARQDSGGNLALNGGVFGAFSESPTSLEVVKLD